MSRRAASSPPTNVRRLHAHERAVWLALTGALDPPSPALDAQLERNVGLNLLEHMVLAMRCEQRNRSLGTSDLARANSCLLSRLPHVAERLEKAGCVGRVGTLHDARCTDVMVTSAGARVFDGLSRTHVAQVRRINDAILERIAPGGGGEPFTGAGDRPSASAGARS